MRRFQLKANDHGDTIADGVCFQDGACTVQWLTHPRTVQRFESLDDLLVEYGSRTRLSWIDATSSFQVDADCGCDFVQTLGRRGAGTVEVHHQFPDDSAPHVDSLECGCGPALTLQLPDVVIAEHTDTDATDD